MPKQKREEKTMVGRFQAAGRGFGFFTPQGAKRREEDLFVPPRAEGRAWDGDTVEAVPGPPDDRREGRPTARVVRVLERANRTVTGTLFRQGRELWLQPDSEKLRWAVKLLGRPKGVGAGERAAVEMRSYGSALLPPAGVLRAVFGSAGTREASTAAVLYRNDIGEEFPPAVLEEAAAAPREVDPAALAGRLDLRGETVITIDGESAKDLDDAVSLWRDGEGRQVLGVHIADVSHYVAQGSALDAEAFERGASVYFADRVIPMLPVELSNGICSLNPGVDRLALTCLMTVDGSGQVVAHSLRKSVIRSAGRMTYTDCNTLLAGEDPALAERYAHILPMLREMAALSRKLKKLRRLRGALDLDTGESHILCDERGVPVDIVARRQGESEELIESFMLAANETVAEHLCALRKPAVYRVHEKPAPDRAEGLRTLLAPFGYDVPQADGFTLQKILDDVREKPEAPVVGALILRAMMKARYDVRDLGHFGLAAEHYCHFTSPIRRYPDLMVHRILSKVIEDGAAGEGRAMPWEKKTAALAARAAEQSSARELAIQAAEREIERLYMAEYMHGHLGETFPGTVSGVVKQGLFIALPNGVEGFLPAAALPSDHWHHDEGRMTLRGEYTGAVYAFGMGLEVLCAAADPGTGEITFALPGGEAAPKPAPPGRKSGPGPKRGPRPPKRPKPPRHKPGRGRRR